jgi:hypothetical protein
MGSLTEDPAFLSTSASTARCWPAPTSSTRSCSPGRSSRGCPTTSSTPCWPHYGIPQPSDRQRAGADVEVTAELFFRLIRAADEHPEFSDLAALAKIAGRTAKSNIPVQGELF